MKGRGLFFVLAIALVLAFASVASANVSDVPYGTLISNTGYVQYTGYTFSGFTSSDTDGVDTAVDLIVGCTIAEWISWRPWAEKPDSIQYFIVSPLETELTDTVYYPYANTGNDTEQVTITITVDSMWIATQTTDFQVGLDTAASEGGLKDFRDTAATNGALSISDSGAVIGEDAVDTFILHLVKEAGGVGGEGCTVVVKVNTNHGTSVNSGPYTGDNGESYAEGGFVRYDTFYIVIVAPNIQVNKTDTVTLGGSLSAAIPGATIHYILGIENIGNDTAINVFIYDHIDTNYLELADTYAPNADTVWVSAKDTPTIEFNNASGDWVLATSNNFATAQWIKYDYNQIGYVAGSNSDTVYFDVYIK